MNTASNPISQPLAEYVYMYVDSQTFFVQSYLVEFD